MAMTYTSLTGAKGVSGAIATWVDYTLLDIPPIVDEAQALIYSVLRCREMRSTFPFTLTVGQAYIPLPARFLDPIGRIQVSSFNAPIRNKDQNSLTGARNYTETAGTLGTDPLTTVLNSNSVNVALTAHGFAQDSLFYTTGAAAFNGATIAGTFPISAIVDANNFTIDISSLGTTPSAAGSGGGAAVIYTCDNLVEGQPTYFSIYDERINFDVAAFQQQLCRMDYYKSPALLSSSNQNNFLTDRYPQLMRVACMASAADFMKDDAEFQKQYGRLVQVIERVSVENDMSMRGMEVDTFTP